MYEMYVKVYPIFDKYIQGLCIRPYPLHPKGCPNYRKKPGCPPGLPLINKILDLDKPVYAIYNVFDFKAHCEKMRRLHPEWSDRQIRCCLYWQGAARKQLKDEVINFKLECPEYTIIKCPEAHGVNLTETMNNTGVHLEWPPKNTTYQIVLAGYI